jgi:hypothetical protein
MTFISDNGNSFSYNYPFSVLPKFQTRNKKIAVEDFPDRSVKTEQSGTGTIKAVKIQNKTGLVRLKVLFPSDGGFVQNSFVYVRGELYTQPWARETHEFEGTKFILMPESYVEAVESPEYGITAMGDSTLAGGIVGVSGKSG